MQRAVWCVGAGVVAGCSSLAGIDALERASDSPDAAADIGPGPVDAGTEPTPPATVDASDASACAQACHPGYACIEGRCGNEIASFDVGFGATCAVLVSGELWCWGDARAGESGVLAPPGLVACEGRFACIPPTRVQGIGNARQVSVATGAISAVDRAGNTRCWGNDSFGILGVAASDTCRDSNETDSGSFPCTPAPAIVKEVSPGAVEVAVGSGSAYAALGDGGIWGWGGNFSEIQQRPYAAATNVFPPHPLSFQTPPAPPPAAPFAGGAQIATGYYYDAACSVRAGGRVECWGGADHGKSGVLGAPDTCGGPLCRMTPAVVMTDQGKPLERIVEIGVGEYNGFGVDADGRLWAWGSDVYGLRGLPSDSATDGTAVLVNAFGGKKIRSISIRQSHAVALDAEGAVWAWGDNRYGALGQGTVVDADCATSKGACAHLPAVVPLPKKASAISAGPFTSAALLEDGRLFGWGLNNVMQMGARSATEPCKDEYGIRHGCALSPEPIEGLP